MAGKPGGRKNNRRPKGSKDKTPEALMNQLVPAGPRQEYQEPPKDPPPRADGFAQARQYIDPVTFCLALVNCDPVVLNSLGIMKPPSVTQMIEAARIVIPYTNKRLPLDINTKHEHSWAEEMTKADERVSSMRKPYDGKPDSVH